MILDKIIESKRKQLSMEMKYITVEGWKQKLKHSDLHKSMDFASALRKKENGPSIIAEVKKASPSKGIIRQEFNPVQIAKEYINSKVSAISILTEKDHFLGDDDYLARIRQVSPIPLLRKDFIIDVWQIYQSRFLGADAILLIAAMLDTVELKKFQAVAGILGLHCLVEVHDEEEALRAMDCGAKIIGINNRNLKTFEVSLETTEKIINLVPRDRITVSESGIRNNEDMKYLDSLGIDAVLIGETFMRSNSIENAVNEMRYGT